MANDSEDIAVSCCADEPISQCPSARIIRVWIVCTYYVPWNRKCEFIEFISLIVAVCVCEGERDGTPEF